MTYLKARGSLRSGWARLSHRALVARTPGDAWLALLAGSAFRPRFAHGSRWSLLPYRSYGSGSTVRTWFSGDTAFSLKVSYFVEPTFQ